MTARPPGDGPDKTLTGGGAAPARAENAQPAVATLEAGTRSAMGQVVHEGAPAAELPLVSAGNYELGHEIAAGGMGRIYAARDLRLDRPVAIKQLLVRSEGLRRRFEREIRLSARLQHPGIVSVLEAGQWSNGDAFYVMKLVSGRALGQVIDACESLDERLALLPRVIAAADALAYAHGQGIIHRDLKPANVLVGDFGETVVIDWGLAKDLRGEEYALPAGPYRSAADSEGATVAGAVMGTPAYMPPEQARGASVDERADVYALGAMLYHVLSGAPPFQGASSQEVLEQVLARGPEPLERRQAGIPPDLLAIVAKAMAAAPQARYPSAAELAADLRRFETGQLVAAHEYSGRELLARWLRRHRTALVISSLSLLVLAVVGAISLYNVLASRRQAEAERAVALRDRGEAQAARAQSDARARDLQLAQARVLLDRDPTLSLAWLRAYLDAGGDAARARMVAADAWSRGIAWRVLRGHTAFGLVARFLPDGQQLATASWDGTIRLWDLASGTSRILRGHAGRVLGMTISHDGSTLASRDDHGELRAWNVASGASTLLVADMPVHSGTPLFVDEDRAVLVQAPDGHLRLVDVKTGSQRSLPDNGMLSYDVASDRVMLAVGTTTGLELWHLRDGTVRHVGHFPVAQVVWAGDGRSLAAVEPDFTIHVVAASGTSIAVLDDDRNFGRVVVSPNGRRLVRGGNGTLHMWDLDSGASKQLAVQSASFDHVWFMPDGEGVLTIDREDELMLWRLDDGSRFVFPTHGLSVRELDIAADGRSMATISHDGTARVWRLDEGLPRVLLPMDPDYLCNAALSPDGTHVAALHGPAVIAIETRTGARTSLGSVPPGTRVGEFTGAVPRDGWVVWAPDGRTVAATDPAGTIHLYALAGGPPRELPGHTGLVTGLAFSRDGRTLLSAGVDATLRLWDVERGTVTVVQVGRPVHALAADPSGRLVATGDDQGGVRLWLAADGAPVRALPGARADVLVLAFSPDGTRLASGQRDSSVSWWDVGSGAGHSLAGHVSWLSALAFSPDGRTLASGGADDTVRLWDLDSGSARVLSGHTHWIRALAFSPDGTRLASGGLDGNARLWDVATGESRRGRHRTIVVWVAFTPDGTQLVSGGNDVRVWSDDLPRDRAGLRAWIDAHTNATIEP